MARKIEVQIVGDASSFHKALGSATSQSSRFGGILKGGLRVAAAGAGLAILGLGYAAKRGADDLLESQKVAAQLRAVLKSTGGAAGVTAKHVNALAQSLSNMSGVDDEAIGAGENLLLCLEDSAQALTRDRGWVSHDQLAIGDEILAYDPEDDATCWEPILDFYRYHVETELIRWQSKQIDVATTPHHRWWTTGRTTDRSSGEPVSTMQDYQFRTTEEVSGHQFAVKIGGGQPGCFRSDPIFSDELVELAAWVVTEGSVDWLRPSTPDQYGVKFSQSETANPYKVARIRGLVSRLRSQGHEISEFSEERNPGEFTGAAVAMATRSVCLKWSFAKSLGKAMKTMLPEKTISPSLLSSFTAGQAELFLDVLVLGDGHIDSHGHRQFIQKDETQLDMVAGLCSMLGIRTSRLGRGDAIYLCTSDHAWGNAMNTTRETYDGIVWCPQIRTQIFAARNRGRTFWTGNTFRNIQNAAGKGNDIFDQATKATLDLSVAMDEDLHSAALQVGKALNDPVKGLTALKRVGVQFSDAQTNMIKKLVDTGKTAQAQKIILGELRKEFGGSAKAAGDTLPGQLSKLRNAFDNVASSLLAKLLPPFTRFITWVTPLLLKGMDLIAQGITLLVQPFKDLAAKASDSSSKVGSVFHKLVGFFTGSVVPIVMRLKDVFVQGMQAIRKAVESQGPALQRIFNRIGTAIRTLATIIIPILKFALTKVLPIAIKIVIIALDKLTFVVGKVADVVKWIAEHSKGAFNTLKGAVQAVAKVIAAITAPILSALGKVRDAIQWILDHLPDIPSPGDILGGGGGGTTGKVPQVPHPSARFQGVGAQVTHVTVEMDGQVLLKAMGRHDKTYRRQNGRSMFG